jgi:glycosyltransferase involved in cell wall biosynthesis
MGSFYKDQPFFKQYINAAGESLKKRIASLRRERIYRRLYNIESKLLFDARSKNEKQFLDNDSPLISVTIATYNRGELLTKRTLPSVLNQTYQNFEIVIVGDGCSDDTANRIESLREPRIRFTNLPERGKYPEDPRLRWMVAGVPPINRALDEARGLWIAHLDDDDLFEPDHLETLLRYAQVGRFEFVYSQMNKQTAVDSWEVIGSEPTDRWRVPHSSAFFRDYLRLFKFDIDVWKCGITADRDLWNRMSRTGVRAGFLECVTTSSPLRPGTTSHKWLASDRDQDSNDSRSS